jgi:hypothetical protein
VSHSNGSTSTSPPTLDSFDAFRQPPATDLPARLRAFIAEPSTQTRFALDASQVRAIGDPSHPWYLMPGKDSLCFHDADGGGSCTSIADAAAGRLLVRLVAHEQSPGPSKLEGVAPDGVDSVRVTDLDGATHSAPVVNGTYTVTADRPKAVEFSGPNAPAALGTGG